MIDSIETREIAQGIADATLASVHARITTAEPVGLLSDRGDKRVEVMKEPDGSVFVRRTIGSGMERNIRQIYRLELDSSWEGLHELLDGVGLSSVPSFMLTEGPAVGAGTSAVIISEYVNIQPLEFASLPTKKDLAKKLGRLLDTTSGDYFLAPETVNDEMFGVVCDGDSEEVLFIDMDPLVGNDRGQDLDDVVGHNLTKFSELLWDTWCTPDERQEVMVDFIRAAAQTLGDRLEGDITSRTVNAFMNAHLMTNGIDPRTLPSSRR